MLNVVAYIAPQAKYLGCLDGEVTREVSPAPALEIVRVGQGEPGELQPLGLRALRAHRPPAQPVRDRVLEPVPLRDPVDMLVPDRQAVEVLADDANVVHARLDRVQERVEARRAADGVDACGAGLEVGAELGELPDARGVVGVLDQDVVRDPDAPDRPVVGGHAPAGERRHGGVPRERDRPRQPRPQVGPRAVGAELTVEVDGARVDLVEEAGESRERLPHALDRQLGQPLELDRVRRREVLVDEDAAHDVPVLQRPREGHVGLGPLRRPPLE